MTFIMVGVGSGQCILRVSQIPEVGDTICVNDSMIDWELTGNAGLLPGRFYHRGEHYRVTERLGDFNTGHKGLDPLPWFSLEIVR